MIRLDLTPGEYREMVTALKMAKEFMDAEEFDLDAVDDIADYLTNALEILNEK